MPPPRLPRHLRPCRPLWSAQQVRFASDTPSNGPATAGGDDRTERGQSGAASTQTDTRVSQAQRMRTLLGGRPARHPVQRPSIHTHVPAKKSDHLQHQPRSQLQASGGSEKELREKLKTLEEELARLQEKLRANATKTTKPSTSSPSSERPPSSKSATPKPPGSDPQPETAADGASQQSLLDELFPGAGSRLRPVAAAPRRASPPKLDLPAPATALPIRLTPSDTRTDRDKAIDAFRARGESTTVLQLSNCSTALTEADFRRLIPRGLHIDTWSRDGDFFKIIPGRDPLSLARLPFYYLLFHSPESALAYQKNASRLSKLSALHAPSEMQSAVPPPRGFLEDGEDLDAITSSFVLHPHGHHLDLRTIMQPYNRALRALIDARGYTPIVPNLDSNGNPIHRVLLHIDGYEPSHWDLWQIMARHAHARGILWPFRGEHSAALRRLRDCINLKTNTNQQAVSSRNPRAASPLDAHRTTTTTSTDPSTQFEYNDPQISSFLGSSPSGSEARDLNQLVMNRVYNRWIVEFDDEDAARRFAGMWHRVVLPDAKDKTGAWKEAEEERWVEAEYLW